MLNDELVTLDGIYVDLSGGKCSKRNANALLDANILLKYLLSQYTDFVEEIMRIQNTRNKIKCNVLFTPK